MNNVTFKIKKDFSIAKREAYNTLRANIAFSGEENKVILFTSAETGEGKTTVAFEMARSFANDGKKVILLDCDLRKSVMRSRYRITTDNPGKNSIKGMSHYLTSQASLDDVLCFAVDEGFDLILAGRSTPIPTELLNSPMFSNLISFCKRKYDYVIIDAPAITHVIDAAIIASQADGVVLVIEQGVTSKKKIGDAVKQLEYTKARILGAVLNKVND